MPTFPVCFECALRPFVLFVSGLRDGYICVTALPYKRVDGKYNSANIHSPNVDAQSWYLSPLLSPLDQL